MNRRQLLTRTLACSTLAVLRPSLLAATPKSILVLGGTGYLGPQVVAAALAGGHRVTLFNRGITNPQLFPTLPKLRGLRSLNATQQNLSALATGRWDAVIDVWPSEPTLAATAAQLLAPRTRHYVYISSIAAYAIANYAHADTPESAPLRPYLGDEHDYGPAKAESERRLQSIVGPRLTLIRPGPIEGAGNGCSPNGGLLLTWLLRVRDGQPHIGPGDGSDPIQFIDVKDVGGFAIRAIDQSLFGTFNLVETPRALRDHIAACATASHTSPSFTWIPRAFLEANGLPPASYIGDGKPQFFTGWIPNPAIRGLYQISNAKLLATGWHPRSFADSAADALASCPATATGSLSVADTLPPGKEAAVLAAWRRRPAPLGL